MEKFTVVESWRVLEGPGDTGDTGDICHVNYSAETP